MRPSPAHVNLTKTHFDFGKGVSEWFGNFFDRLGRWMFPCTECRRGHVDNRWGYEGNIGVYTWANKFETCNRML